MTDFDEYERRQWAGRAEAYGRTFASLCGHLAGPLLDAVGAGPGVRVLDVGTGPGTVAALAVARGAVVTAVDAEPSMVAAAARRVPAATVGPGVLPDLPFPDGAFDAAVANFVVNHVGDPRAAVAELVRVVRPGGRVAVTVWPYPAPELQALFGRAVEAAGAAGTVPMPRLDPEKDFARTGEGLAGLFGADVDEPEVRGVTWRHRTDMAALWLGPASGIGSGGVLLAGQSPETAARIRREYERLCAPYREADGLLAIPTAALLGSTRRR